VICDIYIDILFLAIMNDMLKPW